MAYFRTSIAGILSLCFSLACVLPDDPSNDPRNAQVKCRIESVHTDSSGAVFDTVGNAIVFHFSRIFSEQIDSFVVDLYDDTLVSFPTGLYENDSIDFSYVFRKPGRKIIGIYVYLNDSITRPMDSIATITIINRKPVFVEHHPDTLYEITDADSTAIPIEASGNHPSYRISNSKLPEGATAEIRGDTSLIVYIPSNRGGFGEIQLEASDGFDSVQANIKLTVMDKTSPFPPIFESPIFSTSTTPTWNWETGGKGGCGFYRFNIDNDNLVSNAFSEKQTTSFQSPTTLTEGKHTLFIQERDQSGNWSETSSWAITVDTKSPPAPTVYGNALTNNRKPAWTWNGSDAAAPLFRFQLDSPRFSAADTAETVDTLFTPDTDLAEGRHVLYVQERDEAGNWSGSDSFVTVIDLTPPSAPVVVGSEKTNNARPTWSWSSGGNGCGEYRIRLDSDDFSAEAMKTASNSYTPQTGLSEGGHFLYVQERDDAGNWSIAGSFQTTIDTTGPCAPSIDGSTPTNSARPKWRWTSCGGSGTFRYKLDNDDLSAGATDTTALNFIPACNLIEGVHTLYLQESDSTGNWSSTGRFAITVDFTPPSPPIITGATPTNNSRPVWSWTTGGNGGNGTFRYKFNDSSFASGGIETNQKSFTPVTELGVQAHTLYLQERDAAGNWSKISSFTITIDNTGPNAPVVNTDSIITHNQKPTWTWETGGNGGIGKFRYRLDNADLTNGAAETTDKRFQPVTNLAEGTHTLYVQEMDAAKNWSANGLRTVTIDITPPSPPKFNCVSPVNTLTPTWRWTSGGGRGYYMYRLDNAYIEGEPSYTFSNSFRNSSPLTESTHRLYIEEQDAAGNWSTSASFGITIDIIPPSAPIITSVSGFCLMKSITWNWRTGGGGSCYFRYAIDNGSWSVETTNTSYTSVKSSSAKGNEIAIMERDAAGNWSVPVINKAPCPF